MAELKTQKNNASVKQFLERVSDEKRRADCFAIAKMMEQATKAKPKMWGSAIVGFGEYHYKSASGREGDWMLIGFSPRKQNLTLYFMSGFSQSATLLRKLGKHKTSGGSCLYINRLDDIDMPTLKKLIQQSVKLMIKRKT